MILIGIILFAIDRDLATHPAYYAVAIVAVVVCIPEINGHVSKFIDRLRSPSVKIKCLTAAVIFVLSALFFTQCHPRRTEFISDISR